MARPPCRRRTARVRVATSFPAVSSSTICEYAFASTETDALRIPGCRSEYVSSGTEASRARSDDADQVEVPSRRMIRAPLPRNPMSAVRATLLCFQWASTECTVGYPVPVMPPRRAIRRAFRLAPTRHRSGWSRSPTASGHPSSRDGPSSGSGGTSKAPRTMARK